jgi:hypothetical protein
MNARRSILTIAVSLCALLGGLLYASAAALAAAPEAPIGSEPAAEVENTTAKLEGVVNPLAAATVSWYFEYSEGAACAGGSSTSVEGPTEVQAEPVAAGIGGLKPGTKYTFCLVARNEAEEATVGNAVSFTTTSAPPAIAEESVADVVSGAATLAARIDPEGVRTTYSFEYGTTASYGSLIPATAGPVGSGTSAAGVDVRLQELQPDTAYHFRVVATSALGSVTGPDQTFTTTQAAGAALTLPDGRMWELVSPPNKDGGEITNLLVGYGGDMQASESGEAITYIASVPVGAGGQSDPLESQVLSRRGPGGWSSEGLDTRHNEAGAVEFDGDGEDVFEPHFGELGEYQIFSPDLSLAYLQPEGYALAPPGKSHSEQELEHYIRSDSTGTFTFTTLSAEEWYAGQLALAQGPPSCDASTAPDHEAEVDAVSQDGCYVYFTTEAGLGTLYVAHDEGGTWTTTPLPSLDGNVRWHLTKENPIEEGYIYAPAEELSPDGRYLAFMSNASLTGYDNHDAISGAADEEVYLYDAATNRLVCASCNPTGARPTGVYDPGARFEGRLLVDRADEWEGYWLAGSLPDWTLRGQSRPIHQPRYLSNEGQLFFNSPDVLLPQDVNGQENVYEYEPEGIGSCGRSTAGCVSLISSGTSSEESAFVDASASGDDVFFLTSSRLAPQDYDNSYDMYDAHVCSASVPCPAVAPVSPPPCETSDSCKAQPTPQPTTFGATSSETFAGAGNAAQPPPVSEVAPRSLTRAQRLAAALKACRRGPHAKRRSCEARARKRYGAKASSRPAVEGLSKTAKRNGIGG